MTKLISANFIRLKKDKSFWLGILFMIAIGIFFPMIRYLDMKKTGYIYNIDTNFFICAIFIGIIMSIFCSLFIGTEYSDGTIRNKIIVGQKRKDIYLSNLLLCSLVGILMCCVFFIVYLCVGIPLLGYFVSDTKYIFILFITVLLFTISYVSIFTMITMTLQNKTIISIVCILLAFGLLVGGGMFNRMLNEPKTVLTYNISEKGESIAEEIDNPKYLEGSKRNIVQNIYDINPGGQAIQCMSMQVKNTNLLPIYSIVITLATTSLGVTSFNKKDIK